ncbi:MAG: bifunctional ornithine acetyltransferase/N-acetylglutamate synthase [Rhodospirillaceae bacterium TMED8]|nr:bifunctional ornithine acetyltransferase/N-acetylglutamate synthase [Magnetovibrio sp.]OUT50801.1 MAG: bifunctional ornithine acetyltransferase/N-acetylglutamate synthase [Rhodospirillaceae bacterium TMED8]|tara:strand:+ start:182 stop:1426 length:1245 start_codon:yes stop_codon:yes gene_type:complete
MNVPVSPLSPKNFPELPGIVGVKLATAACAIRYEGREDVLLVELAAGTKVAGTLTRSKTAAAPVLWCRECLSEGEARGLLVNSGNANAFTGLHGDKAVDQMVKAVADSLLCRPSRVYAASTGVIGEPIAYERITERLEDLSSSVSSTESPEVWKKAAVAIMTTDTFPKGASAVTNIMGMPVTITGICKGSGMIAPNMATMLGFIFTDAKLPSDVLQALLTPAVDASFNAITVDSDTSTNDTVLMFATGAASHGEVLSAGVPELYGFKQALEQVTRDLAHQIVRDGEGATKFIAITVSGAETDPSAKIIALTIANSPLVKTAIAGEDANWGRIVAAVGKSGEAADRDRLSIVIGGTRVTEAGAVVSNYDEAPIALHMRGQEIDITIDVGVGEGNATVWTCDLTHGYIDINANYRS